MKVSRPTPRTTSVSLTAVSISIVSKKTKGENEAREQQQCVWAERKSQTLGSGTCRDLWLNVRKCEEGVKVAEEIYYK